MAKNRKRNTKNCQNLENPSINIAHITEGNFKDKESKKYKANHHTYLKNTRCYFGQFCNDTSIHGFKFIGERGRYTIERIWWLLVLLSTVSLSGYLIHEAFTRWMSAPVIVTFATRETPIWNIPFPAVTICPEIKVQPEIFNYTDVYLKYYDSEAETTEEEDQYYNLFSIICNPTSNDVDEDATKITTDDEVDTFLNALADVDLYSCKWLGVEKDCNEVLSRTLTSEGWCRTFNGLNFSEIYVNVSDAFEDRTLNANKAQKWFLDGDPLDAELDTYPRRTPVSGTKGGFQIELYADDRNKDYICGDFQGFKVTVHHPAEAPNMNNYFRVPLDQAVVVAIKPRLMTTTKEVRDYRPEDRQCYLPGEKILSNFRIYTQQHCIAECLWNYTLLTCGCLRFDMHYVFSFTSSASIKMCGAGSNKCIDNATVNFAIQEAASKINKIAKQASSQCGCLPACTSVEFETETSQTNWDYVKTGKLIYEKCDDPCDEDNYRYSIMTVYYKEMQFMTSERHEIHGTLDFLANCGGLLGLFCGFSVISIIEILYYLTLRFVCNLRKFGRQTWSGDSELMDEMNCQKNENEVV